ncbi:MAG: metallophosphoesterase [Endomicrobium sp.]|jgi:hypothetical protein|nr:metallophosphoesterase [Endomicrobium sp.]
MKSNIIIRRILSAFTAAAFLLPSVFPQNAFSAPEINPSNGIKILNSIRDAVPKRAGYVTDYKISDGNKFLVFIQDLHCNPEVQKNISQIISSLDEKIGLDKVILEGVPDGKVKNNVFLSLPDNLKYPVVENLLNEGFLTGVELYSVENNKDNVYGVENWQLYLENLYRASGLLQRKNYIIEETAPFRKAVKKSSKSKAGYLSRLSSGERGDKWYSDLGRASVDYRKPFYEYPELGKYLDLKNASKKINIKSVMSELEKYIAELKNTLPYKEYQELSKKHDNQNEYFIALYKAAVGGDFISFISKYPNLYLFLAYSYQSDKIMPLTLYESEEAYVKGILDEALKDNDIADTILVSKMTGLLSPFFSTEMTESEFLFFFENIGAYKEAAGRLFPQFSEQLFSFIENAEYFLYYASNIERNTYFNRNINKYSEDNKVNVLVSGGFHSSLVEELAENGISYAVITPVVKSSADNGVYDRLISINNLNNASLSGRLKANALNPIPLMLMADGRIPAVNREAYLQKLVEMILDPQINADVLINPEQNTVSVSPESFKKVLDAWLAGVSEEGYEISFSGNMFNITLQDVELSYRVKDGMIVFSRLTSESSPENFFMLSFNASVNRIKEIFLQSYPAMIDYIFPRNHALFMQMHKDFFGADTYSDSMDETYVNFLGYLKDGSLSVDLSTYMEALASEKLKLAEKFEIVIEGRKITFIAPYGILKKYKIDKTQLSEIVRKTLVSSGKSINALPGIIALAAYKQSRTLFLNPALGKGIIGFNEALLGIEDQNLAGNMLKIGLMHELKHEFVGDLTGKPLDDFEEETNLEDVNGIIELTNASNPEMTLGEAKNHIITQLGRVLSSVETAKTGRKPYDDKFLRKIEKYVFSIEQAVEMVKAKDLKDADFRHLASSQLEQPELMDAIETLELEISKKGHKIRALEAERESKTKESAYSTNEEVRGALARDIKSINEELANVKRGLLSDKRALAGFKKEYEKNAGDFDENQKKLYSGIVNYGEKREPFEEYMRGEHGSEDKSGALNKEKQDFINKQFDSLKNDFKELCAIAGLDAAQIEKTVEVFDDSFYSGVKLLYNSLPEHIFRRYYVDRGMIANHALSHSIAVLSQIIRIMKEDRDLLSELKSGKINIPVLVYGALMHDLSTIIARDSHERNSVYMIEAIFKGFPRDEKGNAFVDIYSGAAAGLDSRSLEIDVEKLKSVCAGHKKIKPDVPVKRYHQYSEAQLLHDGDGFSAVFDLGRILGTWIEEGTPIFNSRISVADRVEFILNNRFKGSDALNDLIRQGFSRKQGKLYLTAGAIEIMRRESLNAENILKRFIDKQASLIKTKIKSKEGISTLMYSGEDIRLMKNTVTDVIRALKDIGDDRKALEAFRKSESSLTTTIRKRYDPVEAKKLIENEGEPAIAVISDIHASSKIKVFLKEMLGIDESVEITPEMIKEKLAETKDIKRVYVLGDIFDRGDDAYEVFLYIEAVMESGKGFYIMGNHDLWARMNLEGVHLPSYEGFDGIDDDYVIDIIRGGKKDGTINVAAYLKAKVTFENMQLKEMNRAIDNASSTGRNIEEIIDEYKAKLAGVTTQEFWLSVFAQYVEYAASQEKAWAEDKETAIRLFQEMYGTTLDMKKGKDVLNYPSEYKPENDEILRDAELREWWKAILGHNVGTTIFRGLTDVNKMSLKWWIEKRETLDKIAAKYGRHSKRWEDMCSILDRIIESQQKKITEEMDKGNWAWMVVDAIMYRNFESPHYYATDWIFHKGWGDLKDGLLKSVNAARARMRADGAEDAAELNYVNYISDPFMVRIREFFRKYSNIYDIDEYGHFYTHVLPPVDEDGHIAIGRIGEDGKVVRARGVDFDNQHYEGEAIKIAFDKISEVLKSDDLKLADRMSAYKLLNYLYADETSTLKPEDMASSIAMVGKRLYEEKAAKLIHAQLSEKTISEEEILSAFRILNDVYSGITEAEKLSSESVEIVANLLKHTDNVWYAFYGFSQEQKKKNLELSDWKEIIDEIRRYTYGNENVAAQEILRILEIIGSGRNNAGIERREMNISEALYKVMDTLEIVALFMGHNPNDKMQKQKFGSIISNRRGEQLLVLTDYGISVKYGDLGGFLLLSPAMGIVKRGFEVCADGVKRFLTTNFVKPNNFIDRVRHIANITMRKSDVFTTSNAEIIDIMINDNINSRYANAGNFSTRDIKSNVFEIIENPDDFPVVYTKKRKVEVIIEGLSIEASVFEADSNEGYKTVKIYFTQNSNIKSLQARYEQKTAELILSKIIYDRYLIPSKMKVIVRTGDPEMLRTIASANENVMKYVALITERKDGDNGVFEREKLGSNMLAAILGAYGKGVNFELLPPALGAGQLLGSESEKEPNNMQSIASMLAAA